MYRVLVVKRQKNDVANMFALTDFNSLNIHICYTVILVLFKLLENNKQVGWKESNVLQWVKIRSKKRSYSFEVWANMKAKQNTQHKYSLSRLETLVFSIASDIVPAR